MTLKRHTKLGSLVSIHLALFALILKPAGTGIGRLTGALLWASVLAFGATLFYAVSVSAPAGSAGGTEA